MPRMLALVAFIGWALLAGSASAQAPAVDPQSLVGEWVGEWKTPDSRFSGRYYLTIHKVEGNKVLGKVEFTGGQSRPPYEVEGKLEGNVLKYSSLDKQVSAELNIIGTTMTGPSYRASAGTRSDITASKKK